MAQPRQSSTRSRRLHVARIQWEVSGGQFCIGDRSLIVMHK